MTQISPEQLERIKKILDGNEHCQLVGDVAGLVTCDGLAVECDNGMVVHPLDFLRMLDEVI